MTFSTEASLNLGDEAELMDLSGVRTSVRCSSALNLPAGEFAAGNAQGAEHSREFIASKLDRMRENGSRFCRLCRGL